MQQPDFTELDMGAQAGMVRQAQQFVLSGWNDRQENRLVFHNYANSFKLVRTAALLCYEENLSSSATEAIQIASWFLFFGFAYNPRSPLEKGLEQFQSFCKATQYPSGQALRVEEIMKSFYSNQGPTNQEAAILSDAYTICFPLQNFQEYQQQLVLEKQLLELKDHPAPTYTDPFKNLNLFTHYARVKYGPQLTRLATKIHSSKSKGQTLEQEEAGLFEGLEKKIPNRAVHTFFRTNFRNHINLSSIADNKANIMISVNSILISVLITVTTYQNIGETNPKILLPVVIFVVTGLASLIFAVLSARPKVTNLLKDPQLSRKDRLKSLTFFGNFINLPLEEFEADMDIIFRDGELMYGNLVRDLYHLGKVLDQKYYYLKISYTIFMVGFGSTVIAFLIALF